MSKVSSAIVEERRSTCKHIIRLIILLGTMTYSPVNNRYGRRLESKNLLHVTQALDLHLQLRMSATVNLNTKSWLSHDHLTQKSGHIPLKTKGHFSLRWKRAAIFPLITRQFARFLIEIQRARFCFCALPHQTYAARTGARHITTSQLRDDVTV